MADFKLSYTGESVDSLLGKANTAVQPDELNNYYDKEEIQDIVDTKADLNSPILTGIPQAPTAPQGTMNNQIATTSFVYRAMKATIQIQITPAHQGIVATATLKDTDYSVQGSSSSSGFINLPVDRFGLYNITYDDPRVKSDRNVSVMEARAYDIDARYTTLLTYTLRIDENNSNPLTACTYLDDAAEMTKGSADWDTMPIFEDIRPCMFKNGKVEYYLNPNDFTKKYGSTDNADLTGEDGDVMIEFRRFAYKIYREDHYLYVSVTNKEYSGVDMNTLETQTEGGVWSYDAFSRESWGDLDRFYHGAFKGYVDGDNKLRSLPGHQPTSNKNIGEFRTYAQNNGDHYQQSTYAQLKAIQCLYLIKYGNRNGQEALGQGVVGVTDDSTSNLSYVTGYNVAADDGVFTASDLTSANSTFATGMNYGSSNNKVHMKLFGIEDFWGNIYEWVDGLTTDADRSIVTSWNDYSGEDSEFTTNTLASGLEEDSSGWITKVAGTSQAGFMPVIFGGSSSTHWADYGYLYASRVLFFGGCWLNSAYAGPFYLRADISASTRYRSIGARLSYS